MSKLNLGTKAGKAKGDMWVAEGGENIEALPGMGEATVKALAEVGVTTTAQLTGIALSFFSTGTTAKQRAERFYDWLRENVAPLTSFRSAVVRCIFERLQRNGFPDLLEGIAEGDEEAEGEDA